jgi:hypothetical protein
MLEWYSGSDNYRKHTLEFGEQNVFTTELLDVELKNVSTVQDALQLHLDGANLPIEVLYSGGLDSESVILHCIRGNIPVVALTLRLLINNLPINVADLYYAEKFCNTHNVTHKLIDFHIDKFFNNGDHMPYVGKYQFTRISSASILWLIDQCTSFPVVGGDYTWPQNNIGKSVYSPHRFDYNFFDLYMKDNNISGIGNMLSHSLDSNMFFIKEHLKQKESYDKSLLFHDLGFVELENRHPVSGWELISNYRHYVDMTSLQEHVLSLYPKTTNVIIWNNQLGDLIGSGPGKNDDFGY